MSATLPKPSSAPERPSLAGACAKADLAPHPPAPRVRDCAAEAVRAKGTHKGAASDLGLDRSRFSHKLKDGSLRLSELEELGPDVAVKMAEEILEHFAPLVTPAARMRHQLRMAKRALDEAEQLVEFIA